MTRRIILLIAIGVGFPNPATHGQELDGLAFFESRIRPILVERCQECHSGRDGKGGLTLDSRTALLEGGDTGPAAIPGNAEASLLIQALHYDDDILKMPPKGKLEERQIADLENWVNTGLAWPDSPTSAPNRRVPSPDVTEADRQFWSFRPITEPKLPNVQKTDWPLAALDVFVLSQIEDHGLTPAPEADRRAWLRRVTFDLIGLPPTPEQVEAFLDDERADAYERVVDRLLASPQHGERWARHWLDLVRYADSRDLRGIGGDTDITEAWRYRDWVVNSLNADRPYDRFLIDQIAGDLIPLEEGPNDSFNADGMVATGLLTIGEWGTGDADKEKMLTDIVDDQIDVVGRVFLGLTLACARCHDHKFDPIPTADYYGLAGIFFSTRILPDPGQKTAGSPMLRTPIVPSAVIEASKKYSDELARLENELRVVREAAVTAYLTTELTHSKEYLNELSLGGASTPTSMRTISNLDPALLRGWRLLLGRAVEGRLLHRPAPNILNASGVHAWLGDDDWASLTVNTTDQDQRLLTFLLKKRSVAVHPGPRSDVAIEWTSPLDGTIEIRGSIADADPACGDGVGWSIEKHAKARVAILAQGELENGGEQALPDESLDKIPIRIGDRLHLRIHRNGEYSCDTTRLDWTLRTTDGRHAWDLTSAFLDNPLGRGNPRHEPEDAEPLWRVLDLASEIEPSAERLPELERLASALDTSDRESIDASVEAFDEALHSPNSSIHATLLAPGSQLRMELNSSTSRFDSATRDQIAQLESEVARLRANPPLPIPVALVAQDGGVPRSAHAGIHDARIHIRGDYRRLGDVVPRHFPRVLAGDEAPAISDGSGRRELAEWLARAQNPLTPRVMVNRIWQHHFSEGLVRTPSNFGALGERPTHPELLDHLARRFIDTGWSMKRLHREIVLSATYRQASRGVNSSKHAIDPENLWLARANRRRLEAEALRDSLLFAADRLQPNFGGPAFRQFEIPRRSIYLMTIRSDRSSYGPLFDAADPAAIVDERTESTVAPQCLFLLNHPFPLEIACAIADRAIGAIPGDDDRLSFVYRRLFQRNPDPIEKELALDTLGTLADNPRDAWIRLIHALLCSNEFFYVD